MVQLIPILVLIFLPLSQTAPIADNSMQKLKHSGLPVFFIIGGPGAGKSTMCKMLAAKYGLTHISTGDLIRAEIKSGSPRSIEMAKYTSAGELVPLDIVFELLELAMVRKMDEGSKGFLIDGYPRDTVQGDRFENELLPVTLAIYLEASDEVVVQRLLKRGEHSGRSDDNAEVIKNRLRTFHKTTAPVIDQYTQKGKLVKINAEQSIDDVYSDLSKVIEPKMNKGVRSHI